MTFRIAFLFVMLSAVRVRAVEDDPSFLHVQTTLWGFDNTVQRRTFMPLSVQVQNISPNSWSGEIRLKRFVGRRDQVGAPLIQQVNLQPNETRWVQFVPYVLDENDAWGLEWGPEAEHRKELPSLSRGVSPTVLLYNDEAVIQTSGVLRRMPEHLFPVSVTATDGLRGVIMNEPPFWVGARAQAFLDWLAAGGRVYLLHNAHGAFPVFPVPLDILNQEQPQFTVGEGVVKRIPVQVDAVSLDFARKAIYNDDWSVDIGRRSRSGNTTFDQWGYLSADLFHADEAIFKHLKVIVAFHRPWWLIYICVVFYLLALYPLCYRIGHLNKNVSRFYIVFFGSAAAFSLLFGLLGQVGGSAENRIGSVGIVRPVRGNVYDVLEWSQLAVVHAGTYELGHSGSGVCSSTCQEIEKVDGTLAADFSGAVSFTMPPASTRTLLQRYKLTYPRPQPRITSIEASSRRLLRLSVDISGCYPVRPLRGLAIFQGTVHQLRFEHDLLELDPQKPVSSLGGFLIERPDWSSTGWGMPITPEEEETLTLQERYDELLRPLIARSYQLVEEFDERKIRLPDDVVRLAILVPRPDEFRRPSDQFTDQSGAVLFVYDQTVDIR